MLFAEDQKLRGDSFDSTLGKNGSCCVFFFHNQSQPGSPGLTRSGRKLEAGTNLGFAHLYTTDYNVLMSWDITNKKM